MNLKDPLVQMKITDVVCSAAAILSTIYRLILRRNRLWWDDGWAVFSLLALIIQIASVWMHVSNPADLSPVNRVAAYYLLATSFYAVIWSARLSILYSVIRLDPSPHRRKILLYIAAGYMTVTVILLCQLFWICEPENMGNHWKDLRNPQCTLNKQVAICQLVSDIIADLILILAPVKLFSELGDRKLRVRLVMIFSTCIVTTIVSLVHATYILTLGGPKVLIAALVEDCMSLFVCNVPVVATALFNLREKTPEEIRGANTKASTNIFFHRKTERTFDSFGVDGTVLTLGTLPATLTTYVDTVTNISTDGAEGDQDTMKTKVNLKTEIIDEQLAFPVKQNPDETDGKDAAVYMSKFERHSPDNGV